MSISVASTVMYFKCSLFRFDRRKWFKGAINGVIFVFVVPLNPVKFNDTIDWPNDRHMQFTLVKQSRLYSSLVLSLLLKSLTNQTIRIIQRCVDDGWHLQNCSLLHKNIPAKSTRCKRLSMGIKQSSKKWRRRFVLHRLLSLGFPLVTESAF